VWSWSWEGSMRNPDPIKELGGRLQRRGLPAAYVCRTIRELSEHREDLLAEAEERGLQGEAAQRFVSDRLGNLNDLAGKLSRSMRQSNWCGRHPIFTFCLLPLLSFLAAFLLVMWVASGVGELAGWWKPKGSLSASGWTAVSLGVHVVRWGLFTAIPFWFCWLARNSYCGHRWAFATCMMFSLHGLLHVMKFRPSVNGGQVSLTWGYSTQMDFLGLVIPLGVFALFLALSRHVDAREVEQEKVKA
jgi:hypothetical protein